MSLSDTSWSEFDTVVLDSNLPVIVVFSNERVCAPCRTLAPHVIAIAKKYDGKFHVVRINTEHNANLAQEYGVRSIPTVMLFEDGIATQEIVGANQQLLEYLAKQVAEGENA